MSDFEPLTTREKWAIRLATFAVGLPLLYLAIAP